MDNNATFGLEIYFPDVISNIIFDYSRNPKYEEAMQELDEVFYNSRNPKYEEVKLDEVFYNRYESDYEGSYVSYLNFDRNDVYIMGNGVYNKDLFNHYTNNEYIYDIKFY